MNSITDVGGIRVGHYQRLDPDASLGAGWACGVTVVLPPPGTVGAVDCRGGAPGTRETDLLDPANSVRFVDALLLAGGSAYGLAAADGVMRWLEEHRRGVAMDSGVVPIVAGRGDFRPSGRRLELSADGRFRLFGLCGSRSRRRGRDGGRGGWGARRSAQGRCRDCIGYPAVRCDRRCPCCGKCRWQRRRSSHRLAVDGRPSRRVRVEGPAGRADCCAGAVIVPAGSSCIRRAVRRSLSSRTGF